MTEKSQTEVTNNTQTPDTEKNQTDITTPKPETAEQPGKPSSDPFEKDKKEPEKKEPEKQEEPAKKEEEKSAAPEKYALTLPKDAHLDASAVESLTEYARAQGMSNEQAQALLERENGAIAEHIKRNTVGGKEWDTRQGAWKQQALDDKELGNGSQDVLATTAKIANDALKKYFPESVHQYLFQSGLGSHPEVLRGFYRIGKEIQPDKMVQAGAESGVNPGPVEELFYGNQTH